MTIDLTHYFLKAAERGPFPPLYLDPILGDMRIEFPDVQFDYVPNDLAWAGIWNDEVRADVCLYWPIAFVVEGADPWAAFLERRGFVLVRYPPGTWNDERYSVDPDVLAQLFPDADPQAALAEDMLDFSSASIYDIIYFTW